MNHKSALYQWYKEKKAEVEATGWRRHGGKVGDTVILHTPYGRDFDEMVDGFDDKSDDFTEVWGTYADGMKGCITRLGEGDFVEVEFEMDVWYHDDEGRIHEYTDHIVTGFEIVYGEVDYAEPYLTLVKGVASRDDQLRLPL